MNFFSSLFVHKKAFLFVFLFALIFSFALPNTSLAQTGAKAEADIDGKVEANVSAKIVSTNCGGNVAVGIKRFDLIDRPVAWFGPLLKWFPEKIALIVTSLTDWIISVVNGWTITKPNANDAGASAAFSTGWAQTRDLANMLIVLGFVIIGIATALRIKEYEAKKALWPLILVALLVNFSGLFVGLIVDASNLTMRGLVGTGSNTMAGDFFTKLSCTFNKIEYNYANDRNLWDFLGACLFNAVIYLAVALSFFYLAMLMIVRYVVMGILFILSPLAFAFWAFPFPKAKDLWNKWWSSFLKWAFAGVGMCFFLGIAYRMLSTGKALEGSGTSTYLFVVLIVIVAGVYVSIKGSGMLGAAVMGIAGGAAGYAIGAAGGIAKGGAKMADKATGGAASSGAKWAGNKYSRGLEALGLRKAGSTAAKAGEAMKEPQSRMSALIAEGNVAHVMRVAKGEGMGHSSAERAGATAALLKSGDFDVNDSKQVAGLINFQNQGGNLKEHGSKDPRLARYDVSATRKTMKENNISEAAAQEKNVASAYSRLGPRNMGDLPSGAIDENFFKNVRPQTISKAADLGNFNDKQTERLVAYTTKGTDEQKKLQSTLNTLRASNDIKDVANEKRIIANVKTVRDNIK